MKKIPMRRCVATNESYPKNQLLRIVKTPEGEIKVDLSGKVNGKGAYLKKDLDALNIAQKKQALERALNAEISSEIYAQIKDIING